MKELLYKKSEAVAALNRVDGFHPMELARKIGEEGQEEQLYLDVKYRKLWFRLVNPAGKIISRIITFTENMAVVEARIYLDKCDQEDNYVANSFSQKFRSDDPKFGDKFLEMADEVIREAEKVFGKVDRRIMIPLADHISFAVSRIRNQEQISNPLTDDIRVLFHNEFQAASVLRDILQKRMQITIDEHEIGYVALHIHSAIEDEKVSVAMQTARAVRECIEMIEKETGKKIDVISLSYNRLMNHIKYMVARAMTGEDLRINMNEYIESKFPEAYMTAKKVCNMLGKSIGKELDEMEIGYLAMHIERIYREEIKA